MRDRELYLDWESVSEIERVGVGDLVRAWGTRGLVYLAFIVSSVSLVILFGMYLALPFVLVASTLLSLVMLVLVYLQLRERQPQAEALLRGAEGSWTAVFARDWEYPGVMMGEAFIVRFREEGLEIRGRKRRAFLAKDEKVEVLIWQEGRESRLRIGPKSSGLLLGVRDSGILVQRAYEGRFLVVEG